MSQQPSKDLGSTTIVDVNKQHLDEVNWDLACFPIGAKSADGSERPWLQLNWYELKLLSRLLQNKIVVRLNDPSEGNGEAWAPVELRAPIDECPVFKDLIAWCEAAAAFLIKRGEADRSGLP